MNTYQPAILNFQTSGINFMPNFDKAVMPKADTSKTSQTSHLGFEILLAVPQVITSNTGLYRRAPMLISTASFESYLISQHRIRYLAIEEQRIFHSALLKSARSVRKAKKPIT